MSKEVPGKTMNGSYRAKRVGDTCHLFTCTSDPYLLFTIYYLLFTIYTTPVYTPDAETLDWDESHSWDELAKYYQEVWANRD